MLSLNTGSVSWWESNGWGCQPVWGELDAPGIWRPTRVEGCHFHWYHIELAQSILAAAFSATALPLAIILAFKNLKKQPKSGIFFFTIFAVYAYNLHFCFRLILKFVNFFLNDFYIHYILH